MPSIEENYKSYSKIFSKSYEIFNQPKKASIQVSLRKFIDIASLASNDPLSSNAIKFYKLLSTLNANSMSDFLTESGNQNVKTGIRIIKYDIPDAKDPNSEITQALSNLKNGLFSMLTAIESEASKNRNILSWWGINSASPEIIRDLYNKSLHTANLIAFCYLLKNDIRMAQRFQNNYAILSCYYYLYHSFLCDSGWSLNYRVLDKSERKQLASGRNITSNFSIVQEKSNSLVSLYEKLQREENYLVRISTDIFGIDAKSALGGQHRITERDTGGFVEGPAKSYVLSYELTASWNPPIFYRTYDE
jgi:hypothetical protein